MTDMPDDPELRQALIASYSILSLLHYRGIVDSEMNRADIKGALYKLHPFAKVAEKIAMEDNDD
jgi:hypothetical protein